MVERKLFLQFQIIHMMYPNVDNMIVMPITKGREIIVSIQVCVISWMNFDYKENGGKKLFLQIQSLNIVYPNVENMIVVPMIKRMEIIMSIHICLIRWMNFGYKENARMKGFSCKSKVSILCILMRRT